MWDGPAVSGDKVFFGDAGGYFYALDARTGALRWSTRIDTNPFATVTSSPIVYKGRVYVGVSSSENSEAAGTTRAARSAATSTRSTRTPAS